VLETYPVKIVGEAVYLSPVALPLGMRSEGAEIKEHPAPGGEPRAFYIGWQGKCAPALARFSRHAVFALALLVPIVVATAVWFQNPVDRGRFEFGAVKQFEGVLFERPIPRLRITAPDGSQRDHILVGAGKFGPPAVIAGAHGRRIRFSGTLIVREPLHMIELNRPDTFTVLDATKEPGRPGPIAINGAGTAPLLGRGTFTGELVDTKCFSGVMRPATGKVHRGCAIRCLSGGVPPGLLVRDSHGDGVVFLLAGPADDPLQYDVQLAGTLIEVEGRLELHGETPVLRVQSLRRK
jgi:hypothetical protein